MALRCVKLSAGDPRPRLELTSACLGRSGEPQIFSTYGDRTFECSTLLVSVQSSTALHHMRDDDAFDCARGRDATRVLNAWCTRRCGRGARGANFVLIERGAPHV